MKRFSAFCFSRFFHCLLIAILLLGGVNVWGETVTYTITSTTAVSTSGTAPASSSATFKNTYGTKDQMTSGNSQTLTLSGFNGCRITNITLSMKSNKSAGAGGLTYSTDGGSTTTNIVNASTAFSNSAWNGSYTTTYTNVSKDVNIECGASNVVFVLSCSTNSLYCQSYTITYEVTSAEERTITWSVNGTETPSTVTDGTKPVYNGGADPTTSDCDGTKVFVGWTTEKIETATDIKPNPLYSTAELPAVSGDATYCAVFANATSGGAVASLTKMKTGDTFANGDKIVVVANGTTVAMYQETVSTSYVNKYEFDENVATISADDKNWWTVSTADGGWHLGDDTNYYLNMSSNNLYCNGTKGTWTLSDLGDGTFKLQSGGRNLSYRSDLSNQYWRMGGASYGTSGQTILDIYKYVAGSGTTYSDYVTSCSGGSGSTCTTLATPTIIGASEITSSSVKLSWNAVANATSYEVTIIDGDSYLETLTVIAPSCSCTVNNLSPATDYTWAVKAKSNSADYCDSGDSQNNDFTTKPLETFKITWQNNGATYATTTVTEGSAVVLPEETPASCSAIYSTFEGWFTAPAGSDGVPTDALTTEQVTAATIPTANTTYYAVFSDAQLTSVTLTHNGDNSDLNDISGSCVGSSSYDNGSYDMKLDDTGDYFVIPISTPKNISVAVKMVGGKNTSTLQLSESINGIDYTVVTNWTVSGAQNSTHIYTHSIFSTATRYLKVTFTKGSNIGVGAIVVSGHTGTPATGYISTCCNDPAVVTIVPMASTINLGADGKASTTVTCSQTGGGGGSWSYSVSPATATFDGTTFTATAVGDYRLVATYTENCGKTAICNIKVTATPVITFATETLNFEAVCNEKGTGTVEVSGYNCNEKVYLELSNEVADKFYFSPKTLTPDADGKVSGTITVTYKASLTDETESYNGTLSATCGTVSAVNSVAVTATKSGECPEYAITFKYIDEVIYSSTGFQGVTISSDDIKEAETAAKNRVCHTPIDYQFVGWSEKQGEYIPVDVSSKTYIASGRTYYAAYQWIEGSIETLLEDDFAAEINSTKWTTSTCYYENEAARIASRNNAGYLKATINATVGSKISISFDAKKYDSDAQNIVVKVGAETIATITNTTSDYSTYTYEYTLISDNPTISFECTNDHRAYIDNVLVKMAGTIHYTTQPICCPTVLSKPSVWTTVADGTITLHWNLSENAESVTDFTVICRGETSQTLTFDKDTRSHTFTGLTNCNAYTFSVKANGDNTDVCSSLVAYTSAKPSAGSYTVTFDYGAGKGEPAKWTSGCDNGASIDLPTPTPPENHTFVEWRALDGTTITSPYEPTADITLYARYKRDNAIDIVEWQPDAVTIDLNTEGAATVLIENQVTGGTGTNNVADDLFFSKYFEASNNVKLLALFNGTKNPIDLTQYEIKISSKKASETGTSANYDVIVDLATDPEYQNESEKVLEAGQEVIFISYQNNNETDAEILKCAQNDADESGYNSYIRIGGKMNFSGNDAVALVRKSDEALLDLIGAGSISSANLTGAIAAKDFMDAVGWYNANGYEIQADGTIGTTQNYAISTNRCLLIRLNTVKSGANAVAKNTTDFVTLGGEFGEWAGKQIPDKNSEGIDDSGVESSCQGFHFVGGYNYSGYYQTYEELTSTELSGCSNPDGTYTIPVSELDKLSCTKMRIQVSDNENKVLVSNEYKVPIMVKTAGVVTTDELFSKHGAEVCKDCDVVVLANATLQKATDGASNDMPQVRNLEIYAGGTLTVPSGTNYTTHSLVMRSRADQVSIANVDGNLTIADKLYHSKRIDGSRFYFFTLPYDCKVSDITYSNGEVLGISGIDYLLKYYDGAGRAAEQNAGHWEIFTGETLEAGKGYIIAIEAPLNGDFEKNPKKEILFPMTNTLAETTNKTVAVGTYGVGDATIGDNHKGWNLIGVPFMSNYNPLSSTGLKVGTYEDGEWNDDKLWIYNSEVTVPYVTMPNADGKTYTQVLASAQNLEPFRSFFVQVGKEGEVITDVAFDFGGRRSAAPRSVASLDGAVWVKLTLNKGELSDATTIIVDDARTTAYEIGADLEKMLGYATLPQFYSLQSGMRLAFNALSSDVAASAIPLGFYAPTNDTYTISLNGAPSPYLEGVYLTDNVTGVTTNLLHGDYTFTSARAANDTRFSVAVVRSVTAVDNVLNADVSAYVSNRELHIAHAPVGSKLYVFDTLGREIIEEDINAETLQYSLPMAGVYHVQVVSESAKSVYKVVCY